MMVAPTKAAFAAITPPKTTSLLVKPGSPASKPEKERFDQHTPSPASLITSGHPGWNASCCSNVYPRSAMVAKCIASQRRVGGVDGAKEEIPDEVGGERSEADASNVVMGRSCKSTRGTRRERRARRAMVLMGDSVEVDLWSPAAGRGSRGGPSSMDQR
jgi:hypothetical protein